MKRLKILFIYPDMGGHTISFNPAIEILSSFLKQAGIEVELLHLHKQHGFPFDMSLILKQVKKIDPQIVGFSATTHQFQMSDDITSMLKKNQVKALYLLGGVHATISPRDLEDSAFDGFCIGEGEYPLLEVCQRKQKGEDIYSVPGFHFKIDGQIITNGPGKVITNLDTLPFRDFGLINGRKLLQLRNNWLSISFSRGCPYSCNFCINQSLRNIFKRTRQKYFRKQSIDRIIKELLHWISVYKNEIKIINFDDDLLMLDTKWFIQLMAHYRKEIYKPYGIEYAINVRANLVNEEVVKSLKASGCNLLRIGFETGCEKLRNRILSKVITDQQLYQTMALCHQYKVRSYLFAMLGIPGEDKGSIQKTLRMLRELKPNLVRMSYFEPFFGTPIYDYCKENNLLIEDIEQSDSTYTKTSIKFEDIDAQEVIVYRTIFPWFLNMGFVGDEEALYRDKVEQYRQMPEQELIRSEVWEEILETDQQISEQLSEKKVPHFCFFQNNPYYYHLKTF